MNKRERFFSAASAGIFTAVTVCVLAVVLLTPPARYSLTDKPYLLGNLPLLLLFLPVALGLFALGRWFRGRELPFSPDSFARCFSLAALPLPALVLYQAAWCVLAMIFPLFQRY